MKQARVETLLVPAVLAAGILATPTLASAQDKAACLDAASKGQVLRDTHDLIGAREQFRVCASQKCPAMVQQDCGAWLGEVDRGLPTVVLAARTAGGVDVVNAEVSVDGKPLVSRLDGQAIPLNPGPHTFVFEGPDGWRLEREALIKEGQKDQSVSVVVTPRNPSAPALPAVPVDAPAPAPAAPAPVSRGSGGLRLWGWIVGGVGIVGLGTGVSLGLAAKSRDNTASGELGAARQTDSQSAAQQGNIATGVFIAGAAALAGGVVMWLVAPSPRAAIGTNGREVVMGGTF